MLAARVGRRRLLIAGWAFALPVPLLIAVAPSWGWIVAANAFLGVNQGLAWSMTVVMKIDLVGPKRRGLALGLNESAGYGGVALAAGISGWLAADFAARDVLVVAGAVIAVVGVPAARCCSSATRRRTSRSSRPPIIMSATAGPRRFASRFPRPPTANRRCAPARRPAWSTTSTTRSPGGSCRSSSPPTARASPTSASSPRSTRRSGASRRSATGHWSDTVGRKPLIVAGMLIQAGALTLLALSDGALAVAAAAAVGLGLGTALVYPTLIAAMSDAVSPVARAPVVGVYRFWRDSGYVLGGLIAGATADALGYGGAIGLVAGLTAASGLWVVRDMPAAPGVGRAQRQPAATGTAGTAGAAAPPEPR